MNSGALEGRAKLFKTPISIIKIQTDSERRGEGKKGRRGKGRKREGVKERGAYYGEKMKTTFS